MQRGSDTEEYSGEVLLLAVGLGEYMRILRYFFGLRPPGR